MKVTVEELQELSDQLSATAAELGQASQGAMQQVNALVNDGWTGAASSRFAELYAQWKQSSDDLTAALDGISAQLTLAASVHEAAEAAI